LVEFFGRIVGAPLKAFDGFDLFGQGAEGILHFCDIAGAAGIFKL